MTSASLFAVLEIKRFVQVKTSAADGGKGGCLQKPPLKKEVENLFSKTISVFTLKNIFMQSVGIKQNNVVHCIFNSTQISIR